MKQRQLNELLKAIEQDSSVVSTKNEHINNVLSKFYLDQKNIDNSFTSFANAHESLSSFVKAQESLSSLAKAHELVSKNNDLLNVLKEKERLEKRIFTATSNTALISTIGAAISASFLPAAVIPAAIVAGLAAIGGYVSKLKLEHDAIEGAKKILEQANSDSISTKG
jgi:hypothetical protein